MISASEARNLIIAATRHPPARRIALAEAAGTYLAAPVQAHYPLPLFDNSAMDGYALRAEDVAGATVDSPVHLTVTAVISAGGDTEELNIAPTHAVRIYTGAPVPEGATAVVRQEDVTVSGNRLTLFAPVAPGANIRRKGEEIQTGDTLLAAAHRLNPAALGFLAGAGCSEVDVFPSPVVGIVITGSEISVANTAPTPGQIFESNSIALRSAIQQCGARVGTIAFAKDDRETLREAIDRVSSTSNFCIVTGGVSVGDFDFVKDVSVSLGYEQLFWKVRQKPGKPLYVASARDGEKLLFGLPGNPASALVCFYEYVQPALLKAMGSADIMLQSRTAHTRAAITRTGTLTHYLKGHLSPDGTVQALDRQGSHMMSSFAQANCLIVVPEDSPAMPAGSPVEVHLLPL